MASKAIIQSRYRRAKCCETCAHEKNRYCSRMCMAVQPNYVCDHHFDHPGRASCEILCVKCAFGKNGDKTCEIGCKPKTRVKSCFSGRKLQA